MLRAYGIKAGFTSLVLFFSGGGGIVQGLRVEGLFKGLRAYWL